jgi:quinol monooxygenase YgiN
MSSILLRCVAAVFTCLAVAGFGQGATPLPLIELRQYTLRPGQRDVLIDLFEREFVESQEAAGMQVIGTFHDLDNPDRFVWIRAFTDMTARLKGLNAFYGGPVWRAHRERANATMVDSDNVLLLHAARPGSGFMPNRGPRPPAGATATPPGMIVATIYYFDKPVDPGFLKFFDEVVRPQLAGAGAPVLASFVTETSPNDFPQLPVREQDHVFVSFARFPDQSAYGRHLAALAAAPGWKGPAAELQRRQTRQPDVLRLTPTPRSLLHD